MRICVILEGCYPYVTGGVSTWIHQYMKAMPQHEFVVWAVGASSEDRGKFKYELPDNVVEIREIFLNDALSMSFEKQRYHFNEKELQALKDRGYHLGVISNNASLYNVFNVLEDYGIRSFMEDVTVSSVTGYRKPHPEIFRISLRQMQARPEECVYVGDTVSRDIIGPKQVGFAKAVQIRSFLSDQKDEHVAQDAESPDCVIGKLQDLVTWLDQINPAKAPKA